jgi:hypothetical protein
MPKAMLFWVVWLICLVIWLYLSWPVGLGNASALVFFVLTGLLGWGVYGKIVQ